jgi:hypothetical protein
MQPDASLGISADFPSATVRDALLFAMQMGAPNETGSTDKRQVRFIKKSTGVQYFRGATEVDPATFRRDRDGKPLDPMIRMVTAADEEILVDVAIEMTEAPPEEVPVGNFRNVKATITLMAEEYAQVKGCREVIYNNDRYGYAYELEAIGLFDLTFHTVIFFAQDES